MVWKRSKKLIFILLSLILVVWLNHNQMTNWHFHVMNNGAMVVHAHPYESNTIPGTPFQEHDHNNFEFLFLTLVFNAVPLLLAFLVVGLLFSFKSGFFLLIPFARDLLRGFYRTLLLRGPPSFAFR